MSYIFNFVIMTALLYLCIGLFFDTLFFAWFITSGFKTTSTDKDKVLDMLVFIIMITYVTFFWPRLVRKVILS
jgi:hypothetical protein